MIKVQLSTKGNQAIQWIAVHLAKLVGKTIIGGVCTGFAVCNLDQVYHEVSATGAELYLT